MSAGGAPSARRSSASVGPGPGTHVYPHSRLPSCLRLQPPGTFLKHPPLPPLPGPPGGHCCCYCYCPHYSDYYCTHNHAAAAAVAAAGAAAACLVLLLLLLLQWKREQRGGVQRGTRCLDPPSSRRNRAGDDGDDGHHNDDDRIMWRDVGVYYRHTEGTRRLRQRQGREGASGGG